MDKDEIEALCEDIDDLKIKYNTKLIKLRAERNMKTDSSSIRDIEIKLNLYNNILEELTALNTEYE